MDRDLSLESLLQASLAEFAPEITTGKIAYELVAHVPDRKITVTWPCSLMEVFFDFSGPGERVFSESVEFYEGESSAELAEYVAYVAKRFLKLNTSYQERLAVCNGVTG